jgi:SAM-dependent methyltransferase
MIKELGLTPASQVLEVASNDGYLLRNFVESGIPCLGIEPAVATAAQAEQLGVEVLHEFFSEAVGRQLAHEDRQADLVIGNNVFAHVPDINDFTRGLKAVLGLGGVITLEFPHLMSLIEGGQFDTVYHEHFSYLSLYTVERIFAQADLRVWKVEKLPTHGGSLRIFGCHADDDRDTTPDVGILLQEEADFGMQKRELYLDFQARADKLKDDLLGFLLEKRRNGEKVVAYGAAAKGSTFLNYAGIKGDLLSCIFDASAAKQGRFMPGSHIPILSPQAIERLNPDYVLILAWNIADEIMEENASLRQFGTKFVTAVPKLTIQ